MYLYAAIDMTPNRDGELASYFIILNDRRVTSRLMYPGYIQWNRDRCQPSR
jgi:hypothetical protein